MRDDNQIDFMYSEVKVSNHIAFLYFRCPVAEQTQQNYDVMLKLLLLF